MIHDKALVHDARLCYHLHMDTMTHKGYAACIEYSDEDRCFIGHIADIDDIVGFHGDTVAQLRAAFEEAVEDYLETCEKLNRPPKRPILAI